MKFKLVLCAALGVLSACSSPPVVRMDPTYEEAAASKFVSTNRTPQSSSSTAWHAQPAHRRCWWPPSSTSTTCAGPRRWAARRRRSTPRRWPPRATNVKGRWLRATSSSRKRRASCCCRVEVKDIAREPQCQPALVALTGRREHDVHQPSSSCALTTAAASCGAYVTMRRPTTAT